MNSVTNFPGLTCKLGTCTTVMLLVSVVCQSDWWPYPVNLHVLESRHAEHVQGSRVFLSHNALDYGRSLEFFSLFFNILIFHDYFRTSDLKFLSN